MKLKTLKDLEGKYDAIESFINSKYLRQEAINWLKEAKSRQEKITKYSWMEFFNIKESDFKAEQSEEP